MSLVAAQNSAVRSNNRRRQSRFHIEASCRFWWSDISGEVFFAGGKTHNLSCGGACVHAKVCPPIGAVVMLEIDLSSASKDDGQSVCGLLFSAEGTVLRHCSDESRFVTMITHATFDNESLSWASEI